MIEATAILFYAIGGLLWAAALVAFLQYRKTATDDSASKTRGCFAYGAILLFAASILWKIA